MEKIVKKKSFFMSLFMGTVMGLVFTLFAQLKNQGTIIPMGLITGILISIVISCLIGLLMPMKKINEVVDRKYRSSGEKNISGGLATALVNDLIFTPLNCCVNMWFGMAMGLTDLPPEVKNIFQRMIFCVKLPYFVPALISTLIIDLIIGFFLCLFLTPIINKITNRICGI